MSSAAPTMPAASFPDVGNGDSVADGLVIWFATAAIVAFALVHGSLTVLLSFLCFGSGGLFLARFYRAERVFLVVFGVATLVTIALYLIYSSRYGTPYIGGGSDDLAFERSSRLVANHTGWEYDSQRIRDVTRQPFHNSPGYLYLIGILIRMGGFLDGFHTLVPRLLNCAVLGVMAVMVQAMSLRLGLPRPAARAAALVTGLFPMMLFVAAHTFRDTIISFLVVVTMLQAVSIATSDSLRAALWRSAVVLVVSVVMLELRFLYVLLTGAIVGSAWYVMAGRRLSRRTLGAVVIIVVVVALAASWRFIEQSILFGEVLKYQESYYEHRAERAQGLSQAVFSLPFPLSILGRVAYATISPIPALYAAREWMLLGVASLVQFFYTPFLVLGAILAFKWPKFWPLIAAFVVAFSAYAFGSFTYRHIVTIVPPASVLIALGLGRYRHLRAQLWLGCLCALGCAGIGYLILKGWS